MAGIDDVFETRLSGIARRNGRLYLTRPDDDEPVAVTVRYLRPLTARTEIVFLDEHEHEVVTIRDIGALAAEEKRLVEDALQERYCLAVIERIDQVDIQFGTRYWTVETDRGRRWFALREPGKNVMWLNARHVVMRDTVGNRYEIPNVAALDKRSQQLVERAL